MDDGRRITPELYREIRDQELAALGGPDRGRLREAAEILDSLVLSPTFVPFLTIEAYGYLD
jgi:malate synthase